jgi:hypothetical protein
VKKRRSPELMLTESDVLTWSLEEGGSRARRERCWMERWRVVLQPVCWREVIWAVSGPSSWMERGRMRQVAGPVWRVGAGRESGELVAWKVLDSILPGMRLGGSGAKNSATKRLAGLE